MVVDSVYAVGLSGIAVFLSVAGVGLTLPLLRRLQLHDLPNARSSHFTPVPRGAGLPIVASVLVTYTLGSLVAGVDADWRVISACFLAATVGFVDDLRGLPAVPRLAAQIALSTIVFGSLPVGDVGRGVVFVASLIWLVGFTNAYNFMDGINGISALNATLFGAWYGGLGIWSGDSTSTLLGFTLAGASLGFLPWNVPQAKVFLGDVGSYGLGLLAGVLALRAALGEPGLWLALGPVFIYLLDVSVTLLQRIARGESPLEAHRDHVYQRMVVGGLSHVASASTVVILGIAVCGVVGLGEVMGSRIVPSFGLIVLGGIYLVMPKLIRDRVLA